jgi:hypothetical protein
MVNFPSLGIFPDVDHLPLGIFPAGVDVLAVASICANG